MDKLARNQLFRLPNVVGFGFGYKVVNGVELPQSCLTILVRKKLPEHQLSAQHLVPKQVDSMFTDVIEVGHIRVHPLTLAYEESSPAQAILEDRTRRVRPAQPGFSIGHYRVSCGTFGAVVYDLSDGQPLILSNNHILANSTSGKDGRARIGDPILQPGGFDGGRNPQNIIARLKRYVALKPQTANRLDCAVAEPTDSGLVVPEIVDIGKVSGVTNASLGQQVQKSGRSTGLTTGMVRALNVTTSVDYGGGRILSFEDQILTTRMSAPGDSGSLVVDMQNQAVGLLFAGSDSATIINPIQPVLEILQVRF